MAETKKSKSTFDVLFAVDVNEHAEKKNNLTYLSWAWAWAEVKKAFPDTTYTIYENADGWNYHTDGRTAWVKTGVTIDGIEHIEYLPVMDYKNKSIPLNALTSFDVNKAIQRSLTKACARHGLGLYIYAGEDLPEPSDGTNIVPEQPAPETPQAGKPLTDKQKSRVMELLTDVPASVIELFNKVLDHYKVENYTQLDQIQANTLIHRLEKELKEAQERGETND